MKSTVLVFVEFYLPGFKAGGPVRSIANMVEALGDEIDFRIITSDRDVDDEGPYAGIDLEKWVQVGKARVMYVPRRRQKLMNWLTLIRSTPHDILYLNSFFSPQFTLTPLIACHMVGSSQSALIVAPRGEFAPAALNLKRSKKLPFTRIAKWLGLYRSAIWHASTDDEAAHIRNFFDQNRIVVARDLATPGEIWSSADRSARPPDAPLNIAFLSRITPMKNLDFALSVLRKCDLIVNFDIWGTLEDAVYWQQCKAMIAEMPSNVRVTVKGAAHHSAVPNVLAKYDLLLLPTRGENFGHVIAEALTAGTPVLISDRTPWRGLKEAGIGWDLPLEEGEAAFLQAIEEAQKRVAGANGSLWRHRVREYAIETLGDPALLAANRELFRQALGQHWRPVEPVFHSDPHSRTAVSRSFPRLGLDGHQHGASREPQPPRVSAQDTQPVIPGSLSTRNKRGPNRA